MWWLATSSTAPSVGTGPAASLARPVPFASAQYLAPAASASVAVGAYLALSNLVPRASTPYLAASAPARLALPIAAPRANVHHPRPEVR